MENKLEKYQAFEAQRFEEMTDAAERLSAPMDHTIWFIDCDGKLKTNSSVEGDDLLTICQKSELAAAEAARTNPDWLVELTRRKLETEEVLEAEQLKNGEGLLVLSPTPDAVLDGEIDIGGYNQHKKTIMVRYWTRLDDRITARYVSLEGGDKAALREAVGLATKFALPDNSEEILATRIICDNSKNYCDEIIQNYDQILGRKHGQEYSYGQKNLTAQKALDIAASEENQQILDEHMATLAEIKQNYSGQIQQQKLEEARQNYAARLDLSEQGMTFDDMSEAGSYASSIGADYSGYCASTPTSAEEAAAQLFGQEKEVFGCCPFCGQMTSYKPCNPVCKVCGSSPGNNKASAYLAKVAEAEKAQKLEKAAIKKLGKVALKEDNQEFYQKIEGLSPVVVQVGASGVKWAWVNRKNQAKIKGQAAIKLVRQLGPLAA